MHSEVKFMSRLEVIEGTWEELTARAEEFRGRKLKLIVLPPEAENNKAVPDDAELHQAAVRLFAEADTLERESGKPSRNSYENAFGKAIAEKHRKMGLKVYPQRLP
jgi:hypothetical protein